jgi:hypothetical protein
LVLVYEKHLSPKDMAQAAAFLSSESGRHYTTAMPAILNDSAVLGKHWTESISPGVQAEIARQLSQAQ